MPSLLGAVNPGKRPVALLSLELILPECKPHLDAVDIALLALNRLLQRLTRSPNVAQIGQKCGPTWPTHATPLKSGVTRPAYLSCHTSRTWESEGARATGHGGNGPPPMGHVVFFSPARQRHGSHSPRHLPHCVTSLTAPRLYTSILPSLTLRITTTGPGQPSPNVHSLRSVRKSLVGARDRGRRGGT